MPPYASSLTQPLPNMKSPCRCLLLNLTSSESENDEQRVSPTSSNCHSCSASSPATPISDTTVTSSLAGVDVPLPPLSPRRRAANMRERSRVRYLRDGFSALQNLLPKDRAEPEFRRMDIIRRAIDYVGFLQNLLDEENDPAETSSSDVDGQLVVTSECRMSCDDGETDGAIASVENVDDDWPRRLFVERGLARKSRRVISEHRIACNARARSRAKRMRQAFRSLQGVLPLARQPAKSLDVDGNSLNSPTGDDLPRIDILRRASDYIAHLSVLAEIEEEPHDLLVQGGASNDNLPIDRVQGTSLASILPESYPAFQRSGSLLQTSSSSFSDSRLSLSSSHISSSWTSGQVGRPIKIEPDDSKCALSSSVFSSSSMCSEPSLVREDLPSQSSSSRADNALDTFSTVWSHEFAHAHSYTSVQASSFLPTSTASTFIKSEPTTSLSTTSLSSDVIDLIDLGEVFAERDEGSSEDYTDIWSL